MDVKRAKEIVRSEEIIQVTLNGKAVWIDSVDGANSSATVHEEDNPADRMNVSVEQLQEG